MLALALAGCHIVYTPDVQQGNLLDKKTVDQLKPGMTKHQVLVLMGTPSVSTPFDRSRWDYVSTFSHRGGPLKIRTLTLTFNNDTLVRTEGDFFAQDAAASWSRTPRSTTPVIRSMRPRATRASPRTNRRSGWLWAGSARTGRADADSGCGWRGTLATSAGAPPPGLHRIDAQRPVDFDPVAFLHSWSGLHLAAEKMPRRSSIQRRHPETCWPSRMPRSPASRCSPAASARGGQLAAPACA